jgi:RNA polymerase sigma-70 factor (ECF subfamily)
VTVREQPPGASDRELVTRAQRGDESAFEELVYRYDRKVLSIAFSFARDADDAKDIYQDVFLRVHKALPRFEFGSEFSTWLYRIVMNVCLNYKKRAAGRAATSLDALSERDPEFSSAGPSSESHTPSPDRIAQDGEIRRHVEEAIGTLSPQEKLVFTLKHFEGYKLREIAAMMDCAEGTVKKYLFTAVTKLRQKLKRVYR